MTKTVLPGPALQVGDESPPFSLDDFNGTPFAFPDQKNGKVVLLWFTNLCPSCQEKFPQMERIQNHYEKKGVEVLAVSVLGDDRQTAEQAIRESKTTLRFLFDPQGEVTQRFAGKYQPGTCPARNIFVIGRDGSILHAARYPGTDETEILNQLDKALVGA